MNGNRVSFDRYLLQLANIASLRGTCSKRQVGAVVADVNKRIVAVSYNGPPSGQPHCIDCPCKGLALSAPVSHLACRSIHAEANALFSAGTAARGGTLAVTTSPCYACALLIVNAGIKTLIFAEENRLFTCEAATAESPRALLIAAGIHFTHLKDLDDHAKENTQA